MPTRYLSTFLRFRWTVLVLWALLLLSSTTIYLKRFSKDNSVGIWLLESDAAATKVPAGLCDLLVHPGDPQLTAFLLQTHRRPLVEDAEWVQTIDAIDGIFSKMAFEEYWLAGTPVINAELNRAARRDMLLFYCVLSLLLVAFGWIFLKRMRDLCVLLAVGLGSVLPPLGLVGAMELSFNVATIMLPTILASMRASATVQTINEFNLLRRTMPVGPATAEAVSALIRPALWTAATTVFGS